MDGRLEVAKGSDVDADNASRALEAALIGLDFALDTVFESKLEEALETVVLGGVGLVGGRALDGPGSTTSRSLSDTLETSNPATPRVATSTTVC